MARRKTVSTILREGIDNRNPYHFAWGLLELSRKELHETGKFTTLSVKDVKMLLQSLMEVYDSEDQNKSGTLHEIRQYMQK